MGFRLWRLFAVMTSIRGVRPKPKAGRGDAAAAQASAGPRAVQLELQRQGGGMASTVAFREEARAAEPTGMPVNSTVSNGCDDAAPQSGEPNNGKSTDAATGAAGPTDGYCESGSDEELCRATDDSARGSESSEAGSSRISASEIDGEQEGEVQSDVDGPDTYPDDSEEDVRSIKLALPGTTPRPDMHSSATDLTTACTSAGTDRASGSKVVEGCRRCMSAALRPLVTVRVWGACVYRCGGACWSLQLCRPTRRGTARDCHGACALHSFKQSC